MVNELLEIKKLNISFGKLKNYEVFIEIDGLNVSRGSVIFFTGNNGSGKSTLLRALFSVNPNYDYFNFIVSKDTLMNLNSSHKFSIDISSFSQNIVEYHKSISYLDQHVSFLSRDSVLDAVKRFALVALYECRRFYSKTDYRDKLYEIECLSEKYAFDYLVDIYQNSEKYYKSIDKKKTAISILKQVKADNCSYGQQKLISILASIIKAIVLECDILALDEPLNHLDPNNKAYIVKLLSDLIETRNKEGNPLTIFIVSHCLVFPFIKLPNAYVYRIQDKKLVMNSEKLFYPCLDI